MVCLWLDMIYIGYLLAAVFGSAYSAVIVDVTDSGTIRSSELSEDEVYVYRFTGYPNSEQILLFNISKLEGVMDEDFRIYNDPIDDVKSCLVFQKRDVTRTSACTELWKREYSTCISNLMQSEKLQVSFHRRGPEQIVDVGYKIINCETGKVKYNDEPHKENDAIQLSTPADGKVTDPTLTNSPSSSFGLATILPIVFSSLLLITVAVVAIYTCRRRSTQKSRRPQNLDLSAEMGRQESPVYEEIPEFRKDDIARKREDPYNRLELAQKSNNNETQRHEPKREIININSGYDSLARSAKDRSGTNVMRILPSRNGSPKSN